MESPHGVQEPEGLLDGSQRLPAFCLFLCRCICLLPCMQPLGKECAQKCEQDHFENAILVIHDHHLYPYHSKGESVRQGLPRYDKERDVRLLNDFNPKNADVERQMAKYKWGFVDENFEPLTSMDFDGAYASENGYAVVIYDGSKALIQLKGVGKDEQAG